MAQELCRDVGTPLYHMKKFRKIMNPAIACVPALFRSSLAILFLSALAIGGYKARPWTIGAAESYPARLSSEGVTIAVQPLFQDALAARVFDDAEESVGSVRGQTR